MARRSRNRKRGVAIAIVFILFFLSLGLLLLGASFSGGMTWGERALLLLWSAVMLALPGRVIFVHVRRKVRTGHWLMDDAERQDFRQRIAMKPMSNSWAWANKIALVLTTLSALAIVLAPVLRHKRIDRFSLFLLGVLLLSHTPGVLGNFRKSRGTTP